MGDVDRFPELTQYLSATTRLAPTEASRVVAEVIAYFSESTEEFVRRRHRDLRHAGQTNDEIFGRIADELAARRVAAPVLSHRQLRRVVYG